MNLLVLPGDGIGPEIVQASKQAAKAACASLGVNLTLHYDLVGFESLERYGTTLREEILERAKSIDGIVLGTQSHTNYPAPVGAGNCRAKCRQPLIDDAVGGHAVRLDGAASKKTRGRSLTLINSCQRIWVQGAKHVHGRRYNWRNEGNCLRIGGRAWKKRLN